MSEEKKKVNIRLRRGEDGKIEPVEGSTPIFALDVKIRPMTYGDSRQYESFGEPLYTWTDEDKIAAINNHVVEPEVSIEDVDDLNEHFDPWTIEDLMQAIFVYSGMQRLFDPEEVNEGNVMAEVQGDRPISA